MFSWRFKINNAKRYQGGQMLSQTIEENKKKNENPGFNNRTNSNPMRRNPIPGWRKTTSCDTNCDKNITVIYRDQWSKNPNNCSDCNGRSIKPIIKSGMQPNDNAKFKNDSDYRSKNNQTTYAYSYNTYLKNRRRATYEQKIHTSKPDSGSTDTYGYGGNCGDACPRKTIVNHNNPKHSKYGAVSSSSRMERLKLNTIMASNCNGNKPCGKYFAGRRRFLGSYVQDNSTNCNDQKALSRVRGSANKGSYNSVGNSIFRDNC